jgi:hypothetical protein
MKWMVHFNQWTGGMFRTFCDGSIADRGVIAASKVPNRFAWNNGDKKFAWNNATEKMPPGNRTAF